MGGVDLEEPWADTTSPSGVMIMTVFSSIAQFERSLILKRTDEGKKAAMARGVARAGACVQHMARRFVVKSQVAA